MQEEDYKLITVICWTIIWYTSFTFFLVINNVHILALFLSLNPYLLFMNYR